MLQLFLALVPSAHAQAVVVPTTDPAVLSAALAGPGITVLSLTVSNSGTYTGVRGAGPSVGTFAGGPGGIPPGVVVSNGWAGDVVQPGDLASGTSDVDKFSPLCLSISPQGANDAVEVKVQFTIDAAYGGIELEYAFGTEESGQPDVSGNTFTDAFGAFLATDTGAGFGPEVDVALVPDPTCFSYDRPLSADGDSCFWGYAIDGTDTVLTHVLPRTTHRLPLATGPAAVHRLTFVACDALDQTYDTAGFVSAIQPCAAGCSDAYWSCGDGNVDPGEFCDDGNHLDGDGCSPGCDGVASDSDGDGLLDAFEPVFGAVVGLVDTDGDGLLDSEVLDHGTSPTLADTDADGVDDPVELGLAGDVDPTTTTDAVLADTDGDGLTDGDEDIDADGRVHWHETDPNRIDTDSDGLSDLYEGGTLGPDSNGNGWVDALDPARTDTDGDGLKDLVELGLGTDPLVADTDADGLLDWADFCPLVADPLDIDEDADGLGAGCDPDPLDADTDDDGVRDGRDRNPIDRDTDGDGLLDGLEHGVTAPLPGGVSPFGNAFAGTDPAWFRADLDPSTTTLRLVADTDEDALLDGDEDLNNDGTVQRWEGDPNRADTDGDGVPDDTDCNVAEFDPSGWATSAPIPPCANPPCHPPLGGSHSLPLEAGATILSTNSGAQLDWALASLPDATGDGADEYVQAGYYDPCVTNPSIVPGGFTGAAPLTDAIGVLVTEGRTTRLRGLPDLAGDGASDLLVGTAFYTGAFANEFDYFTVQYFASPPQAQAVPTPDATFTGVQGDVLTSLDGGGDVDGDGLPELAIGAIEEGPTNLTQPIIGAIWPASSRGAHLLTAAPTRIDFGYKDDIYQLDDCGVVLAGDADGDGLDDLAAFANGDSAYLIYGPVAGIVDIGSLPALTYAPGAVDTLFGALATGDLDGDGLADMVVGDEGALPATDQGALHIVLGGAMGVVPAAWADILGGVDDELGQQVEVADFDGDGVLDVAAVADHSVVLLQGPISPGVLDLSVTPPDARWSEPLQVLGNLDVGDFDGDGFPDLVVGIPGWLGSGYLATVFGGSF